MSRPSSGLNFLVRVGTVPPVLVYFFPPQHSKNWGRNCGLFEAKIENNSGLPMLLFQVLNVVSAINKFCEFSSYRYSSNTLPSKFRRFQKMCLYIEYLQKNLSSTRKNALSCRWLSLPIHARPFLNTE